MNKPRILSIFQFLIKISFSSWVLIGFLISYLSYFIHPLFFSSDVMQFPTYIPAMDPIGIDLKQMLSYSESWFIGKRTPYIGNNLYPPLASILFAPLLSIEFPVAYKLVTYANFLFYLLITLLLPLHINRERQVPSVLSFVFITGLFSYGFQFEIERGQFNVIAVSTCFLSIWIYHYHIKYRYLAYLLFIISVQLKVFPLIFIVMFITDWQDWKDTLKRLLLLLTVNFALFFILGPYIFVDFVIAIRAQAISPYVWTANHSINSFVTLVSKVAFEHNWIWINEFLGLVQFALLATVVTCIFTVMIKAYRQKQSGINTHMLLVCTIGALLIPSVSHDYKLSILAAPVAILLSDISYLSETTMQSRQRFSHIIITLVLSGAYSSTLFSFTNKPPITSNNFPALFVMLLAVTCLSVISKPDHGVKVGKRKTNQQQVSQHGSVEMTKGIT